jgi:hypothetical protein
MDDAPPRFFKKIGTDKDLTLSQEVLADQSFKGTTERGVVGANVLTIKKSVFFNSVLLERVDFPRVLLIGKGAFQKCVSLNEITMPNVESIQDSVFAGCTGLSSVSLPRLRYAGRTAFKGCTSLTDASFPELRAIGREEFSGCFNLRNVYTPNVRHIDMLAFDKCDSLVNVDISKCRVLKCPIVASGNVKCTAKVAAQITAQASFTGKIAVVAPESLESRMAYLGIRRDVKHAQVSLMTIVEHVLRDIESGKPQTTYFNGSVALMCGGQMTKIADMSARTLREVLMDKIKDEDLNH